MSHWVNSTLRFRVVCSTNPITKMPQSREVFGKGTFSAFHLLQPRVLWHTIVVVPPSCIRMFHDDSEVLQVTHQNNDNFMLLHAIPSFALHPKPQWVLWKICCNHNTLSSLYQLSQMAYGKEQGARASNRTVSLSVRSCDAWQSNRSLQLYWTWIKACLLLEQPWSM